MTERESRGSPDQNIQFFHRWLLRFRLIFAYTVFMGGERASTTRRREAGKICALCHVDLPWEPSRERLCEKCGGRKHRVYLHFMLSDGWFCQFLEEDLKTPLPRKLRLDDPAKIVEMAEKGGAAMRLEDRQALDYGIAQGRGSVWLNLTQDQYEKLKRPAPRANPLQRG